MTMGFTILYLCNFVSAHFERTNKSIYRAWSTKRRKTRLDVSVMSRSPHDRDVYSPYISGWWNSGFYLEISSGTFSKLWHAEAHKSQKTSIVTWSSRPRRFPVRQLDIPVNPTSELLVPRPVIADRFFRIYFINLRALREIYPTN